MLLATGSPLVASSAASPMATTHILVVRAFYHEKVVQPVGAIIEVPKYIAAGLIASGKASEYVKPEPAPPVAVEPPPAVEQASPKVRSKKHAG